MKEPGVVFSVSKTQLQPEGEVEKLQVRINKDSKAVEKVCDSGPVHQLQESASGPVGTTRRDEKERAELRPRGLIPRRAQDAGVGMFVFLLPIATEDLEYNICSQKTTPFSRSSQTPPTSN